jgi:hypothetical protein
MNDRVAYGFGSTLLLAGAFLIGSVLHQVFIEKTLAFTSPVAVIAVLAGIVLIALGRRIENRYQEVREPDDEAEDKEDTFDEEAAPFDASDLEKYERDDSR